ncbi:hypothetical protein SCA6_012318 [Theobroma cacao]
MTGGVCLFFILSTELPLVGSDSNLSWFQVSTLIVVENMDLSDNGEICKSMDGGSKVPGHLKV